MFRKLISNLPFNPSLINEVIFYGRRLKQEQAVRRLGVLFVAITMFVQTFAVIVPPERSLAASENHIINGLKTRDDILRNWDAPNSDIPSIYGYFGLTREDIASLPATPNRTRSGGNPISTNDGNEYWTIGRKSLTSYSKVDQQYKDTQVTIQVQGQNTATAADDNFVYHRTLKAWDIVNPYNTYDAFEGKIAKTGETFWILIDCGNFTKIGKYTPPPPVEPISAICTINGPAVIKSNEEYVSIPLRISLPGGKSIPAGGGANGLHLGVTTKGNPTSWNAGDDPVVFQTPPDKQADFLPTPNGISGLTYYDFTWDFDQTMYRRYYVTNAQSNDFDVTINVKVNNDASTLVVRLLDREISQWLPHSAGCETRIVRDTPPPTPEPCPFNSDLPKDSPECKEKCPYDSALYYDDGRCLPPPPPPVTPTPEIEIQKTIVDKPAFMKPGDTMTYLLQFRNKVNASVAENVSITDELATQYFDVVSTEPSDIAITNGFLKYDIANLPFSTDFRSIKITVKLKDQISSGTEVCNASRITANNATAASSPTVCIGVITPCPYDNSVPDINNPNCSEPTLICSLVDAKINRTTRKVDFKTTATSTNPANTTIVKYVYDYGDDKQESFNSTAYEHSASHTYPAGEYKAKVTVYYRTTGQAEQSDKSTDCEVPINFDEDQPLGKAKAVKNVTQDKTGKAASESKLQPKDVLEYTLKTTNAQNYERVGIDVSDYIGDVLDYATLDLEYLKEQGGSFNEQTKKITWKDVKIPANGEVKHTFKVTVKDPIPATNTPSGVSTDFDCKISNEYGNEITINVNCPLVKGVQNLPNTGPGSSLVVMSLITTVVGYFFFRSRLLSKELNLVRNDYAMTGGM